MSNMYLPVSDRAKALYGTDPVERDFSVGDEADMLSAGHLEIVPRPYRVLVNNFAEGEQDSTVELALPIDRESTYLNGGILERVEAKKPAKKSAQKPTK